MSLHHLSLQRHLQRQQSRHPERSASQICRITKGFMRGVEGPRQCFLADALGSVPAANYLVLPGRTGGTQRMPPQDLLLRSCAESVTTFKSRDIHLPSDWDLATLPNKSFVS